MLDRLYWLGVDIPLRVVSPQSPSPFHRTLKLKPSQGQRLPRLTDLDELQRSTRPRTHVYYPSPSPLLPQSEVLIGGRLDRRSSPRVMQCRFASTARSTRQFIDRYLTRWHLRPEQLVDQFASADLGDQGAPPLAFRPLVFICVPSASSADRLQTRFTPLAPLLARTHLALVTRPEPRFAPRACGPPNL
jgi:hypothetical protein